MTLFLFPKLLWSSFIITINCTVTHCTSPISGSFVDGNAVFAEGLIDWNDTVNGDDDVDDDEDDVNDDNDNDRNDVYDYDDDSEGK